MTMIERVERAIKQVACYVPDVYPDFTKEEWTQIARAAVEAMREPTPEMLAVGEISDSNMHLIWTRMIEEALRS